MNAGHWTAMHSRDTNSSACLGIQKIVPTMTFPDDVGLDLKLNFNSFLNLNPALYHQEMSWLSLLSVSSHKHFA